MASVPPILSGLLPHATPSTKLPAPPAWLAKMHTQPGSLNGVKFFVESGAGKFGRRTVIHEFPGRDMPYIEDMGRKGRHLTLQLFVIGADYMTGRDALIAEIEKPGLKRIVHPWLGRMNMIVLEFELSESTREGGVAIFTVVMSESVGEVLPAAVVNTQSATLAAVKTAHLSVIANMSATVMSAATYVQTTLGNAIDDLNIGYQNMIAGLPIPAGALTAVVSGAEAAIRGQNPLSAILGQWSTPAGIVSSVVSLASGSTGLLCNLVQLSYSGLLRGGALTNLGVSTNYFGGSPVTPPNLVRAVQPAPIMPLPYTVRPLTPLRLVQALNPQIIWPLLPQNTPTQIQAATHVSALQTAVAQVAAIEQARLSSALAYARRQDAFAVRDYVCGQLAKIVLTADNNVYSPIKLLQAAVYADLTAIGNSDPQVNLFTPSSTLPALVIAYGLYGDASREVDILARNPGIDPVFVPGGLPLEVLSV